MVSRYFVCFCLVALFAVIAVSAAEEEAESRGLLEKLRIRRGARILGENFPKAAVGCLTETAEACKDTIRRRTELLQCGGNYLQANAARCLVQY